MQTVETKPAMSLRIWIEVLPHFDENGKYLCQLEKETKRSACLVLVFIKKFIEVGVVSAEEVVDKQDRDGGKNKTHKYKLTKKGTLVKHHFLEIHQLLK